MKKIIRQICRGLVLLALSAPGVYTCEGAVEIRTEAGYTAAATAAAQPGRVEIFGSKFAVRYKGRIAGRLPVSVAFETGHTDIREGLPLELPSHLESRAVDIEATVPFPFTEEDGRYLRVGLRPSCATDDGDCPSSAFRLPLRAYGVYVWDETLMLVGGVVCSPDSENEIVPFAGLIYEPNRRLKLNIVPPAPEITYRFTERVSGRVFAEYVSAEYEVTRDGTDGVGLRYSALRTGTGMEYTCPSGGVISLTAARVCNPRFVYRDGAGKASLAGGWYFGTGWRKDF